MPGKVCESINISWRDLFTPPEFRNLQCCKQQTQITLRRYTWHYESTHYFLFLLAEACLQSCWPISCATSLGYSCAQYLSNETLNWFPGLLSEHSIERTGVNRSVDGLKENETKHYQELLDSTSSSDYYWSHLKVFLALFLCAVDI